MADGVILSRLLDYLQRRTLLAERIAVGCKWINKVLPVNFLNIRFIGIYVAISEFKPRRAVGKFYLFNGNPVIRTHSEKYVLRIGGKLHWCSSEPVSAPRKKKKKKRVFWVMYPEVNSKQVT